MKYQTVFFIFQISTDVSLTTIEQTDAEICSDHNMIDPERASKDRQSKVTIPFTNQTRKTTHVI
jgi:hypothetical protein